jgi:hypothetical protein
MLSIFHFFLLFVLWYLLSYDAIIVVLRRGVHMVGLTLVGREALLDGVLGVLVLGMLFQSRGLCGLEEGRFADLALNVASLLVHLELRLGRGLVLSSALALLLSLGTVTHVCDLGRRGRRGCVDWTKSW